ncbi:class F sortase [Streptomyces sp. TRM 70351]|uniref:class F sortase n=1 Tax=Streptomyces sp. TRM 70351 TaxID=3116552 RepID=UPI002E7B1399|nr:class F sortase [Streptomyces sp. TRM 70351]MEE1928151.1 class F sortase [Streptomyces sp. TRM 70351]
MSGEVRPSNTGRLMTGTAWVVLLLALWLWGKDVTEDGLGPAAGDAARPAAQSGQPGRAAASTRPLPPAVAPLDGSPAPQRVTVGALDVRAVVVPRGLDAQGAVDPPPLSEADTVGWYAGGPAPGEAGAALLVGHVDTEEDEAVFYGLSTLERGARVSVTRADGTVAEFTVEDVEQVERDAFDPERVYGERHAGRAELRLITCGGTFDREERRYSANVVVSAYLTGGGSA